MNDSGFTPPNMQELSTKSQARYQQLEPSLIPDNLGKFIAIDPESGDYEIGETREEAVDKVRARHPSNLVFVRKVGTVEKYQRHASSLFSGASGNARLF